MFQQICNETKEASSKSEGRSKSWDFERCAYIVYCGNCWWLRTGGFRANERKVCWKALKNSISKAQFYHHINEQYALSLKKLERSLSIKVLIISSKKESCGWIAAAVQEYEFWKLHFMNEVGFNLQISRARGWTKVGAPAKVEVAKNRGIVITILSNVWSQEEINISPITGRGSLDRTWHSW